jgi:dihydroxyacetone kinase-like predicted kinase
METITKNDLKEMILLSYEAIKENKEKINKINVFPVPDQDTGGNLEKTLEGIKKAIEKKDFKDIKELAEAILDGALESAQGNAGVIYTGFLSGFLPAFYEKNPVDASKLSLAFLEGAKKAKEAICDPKEGTILDVINATALAFEEESKRTKDIVFIFKKALESANKALLETKNKMDILKKADVVDAGGFGFLIILESFLKALEGEKLKEKREEVSDEVKSFIHTISSRYEVVFLIKEPKI